MPDDIYTYTEILSTRMLFLTNTDVHGGYTEALFCTNYTNLTNVLYVRNSAESTELCCNVFFTLNLFSRTRMVTERHGSFIGGSHP